MALIGTRLGGDGHFGSLARDANACFGHRRALLDFHPITEHAGERQAHERDGDMRFDAGHFPVVDRSHLQIVLGHAKRRFHLPQPAIQNQDRGRDRRIGRRRHLSRQKACLGEIAQRIRLRILSSRTLTLSRIFLRRTQCRVWFADTKAVSF